MDAHASPAARTADDHLTEELAGNGAVTSSMFGMPVLKYHKKSFAGLLGDGATFRLMAGTPEHTEALASIGSTLADTSGTGRPMKDWIHVPVARRHQVRLRRAELSRLA